MESSKAEEKYGDIINLPHHVSTTRPRMLTEDRAAQFSPFAALTGYEAAVRETARLTDAQTELTEDAKSVLNEKLQMILERLDDRPIVTVTHFVPDEKKEGGSYHRTTGVVKQIDEYEKIILLTDRTRIPIKHVREIESELFH